MAVQHDFGVNPIDLSGIGNVFAALGEKRQQENTINTISELLGEKSPRQIAGAEQEAQLAGESNAGAVIGQRPSSRQAAQPEPLRQGSVLSRLKSPAAIKLMASNPEAFKMVSSILTQGQANEVAAARQSVLTQGKEAQFVLNASDPSLRNKRIEEVIRSRNAQGLPLGNLVDILSERNPSLQNIKLLKAVNSARDASEVLKPEKPLSPEGKLQFDLDRGSISQSAFDAARKQTQAEKVEVAAAGGTTVNIGAGKGAERLAVRRADQFVDAQDEAFLAQESLARNQVVRDALSNPDVFTGAGGNAVQFFKSTAQSLGFDVQGVADAEIVQNVANRIALSLKEELPGPLSDSDRKFLQSLPPNLTNSPEANRRLLLLADLPNEWKIEKANIFLEHESADGSVSPAVSKAVRDAGVTFNKRRAQEIAGLRQLAKQAPARPITAGFKDIERMSIDKIDKLNFEELSVEELNRVIARAKELGVN